MPVISGTRTAAIVTAAAALGGGVLAVAGPAAAVRPPAHPARVAIAGTKPAWADAATRVSSRPVTTGQVSLRVYLAGRNPSGLAAFARAVSTPGNPQYGHYLTSAEVKSRYGPTTAQVKAVRAWLTGAGLKVTKTEDEIGGYVAVTGTVKVAAKAFAVTFGQFAGPDGRKDRAPEQNASAPASVAGAVSGVSGLDTGANDMTPADTLPPPAYNNWQAGPCSKYYDQNVAASEPPAYGVTQAWAVCGYTPSQIASAYGVTDSGKTGSGQTVAIVGAYDSATMMSDANQYAQQMGEAQFKPGQYGQDVSSTFTQTAANECDAPAWYTEESIDVESVHAMAPDASVVYVGAASCDDSDLLAGLALIVDNNLASIVSASWGEPFDQATLVATYDEVFQAGAARGIGFLFAAGDDGYESPAEDPGSDEQQVDWPTSSPYVTSVGGTSLAIGKSGNYEFETAWGSPADPLAADGQSWSAAPPGQYPDDYTGSGGGGVSTEFAQPNYQAGVVPVSLATSLPNGATAPEPMRVVPDVAMDADPATGMLVGQTTLQPDGQSYAFSLSREGGTSLATPLFAGIEADAQQAAGHRLGFADSVIYERYGTSAFHDVTGTPLETPSLAQISDYYTDPGTQTGPLITDLLTLGVDGEGAPALPAVAGYDDATGVGSPAGYIESFENAVTVKPWR